MSRYLLGILTSVAVLVLVAAGFYLGTKYSQKPATPVPQTSNAPENTLPTNPTEPPASPTQQPQGTTDYVNPSVTIDAINQDIPAKNYDDLGKFMSPDVTIGAYASGCCQTNSKTEVLGNLSANLKDVKGPWHCEDSNTIAINLIAKDSTDMKGRTICTSDDHRVVAFTLNDKFLISRVFIVADYNLILQ